MENAINDICMSVDLSDHPIKNESSVYKREYISALYFFVEKFAKNKDLCFALLSCYERNLLSKKELKNTSNFISDTEIRSIIKRITKTRLRKFHLFSYRIVFISDCFFLCAFRDEENGENVLQYMKELIPPRYYAIIESLYETLYHTSPLEQGMEQAKPILNCWKKNELFLSQAPTRILVTATMSAGKSTLINALIGKPLARTAQEACTMDIAHYYNQIFDDGMVNCLGNTPEYNINPEAVIRGEHSEEKNFSSYFHSTFSNDTRICLIDTPGVNSAINKGHKRTTQKTIREEEYDKAIYLFHAAGGLGREEDASYLKYVTKKIPAEKLIFVVNKLDDFRKHEDSIEESINGVRRDIEELKISDPVICPVSAYYSYLLKLKMSGAELNEDEQDEFDRLSRKFSKPDYDLSVYYDTPVSENDSPLLQLSKRCGIYGLEKILTGE